MVTTAGTAGATRVVSKETILSMANSRHVCADCGRGDLNISQAMSSLQFCDRIMCPACEGALRMRKFLFISRHEPSQRQHELASEQNIQLIHAGDLDAFADDLEEQIAALDEKYESDGVVAIHPLIALMAARMSLPCGCFRNVNRAPVGEKPQFDTDLFVVFSV